MEDIVIPVALFSGLTIVLGLYFWLRYRTRFDMQETIRLALDKGHELTPEIVDRLGHPQAPPDRDLRLALIWLALAAGLALCGLAVPDDTGMALRGTLSGAAFPFALGVAYLLMWHFTRREK
ncbi:MAG TPA: DUF6249 domain-containing protein [Woeseiaceae bacterium]|nr:DUF6249 domain-containing protein [Woeseiaceae bacterium]